MAHTPRSIDVPGREARVALAFLAGLAWAGAAWGQMASSGYEMTGSPIQAGGTSTSTGFSLDGAVLGQGSGLSRSTGFRLAGGPVLAQAGANPRAVSAPVGTGIAGSPAQITIELREAASARLWYQKAGDALPTPVDMSVIGAGDSGPLWAGTVPASGVTAAGLRYHFTAESAFGETTVIPDGAPSGTAVFSLPIEVEDFRLATTSPGQYAMLAPPILTEDSNPEEAFDELGAYDPEQWRFGTYDPTTETVREYPSSAPLDNGRGFWIVTRDAEALEVSGTTRDVRFNETLPLEPGWNQIGPPFAFRMDVDNATFEPGVDPNVIRWTGTGYEQNVDEFIPGQAYWVYNGNPVTEPMTFFVIPRPGPGPDRPRGPHRLPDEVEGWCVRVDARTHDRDDLDQRFGMRADARDELDPLDFADAPPPPAGYVRARFVARGERPRSLLTDFRALGAEGAAWDLLLDTDQPGARWELRFDVERDLPARWRLLAMSPDGTRHDLTGGGVLDGTVPGTRIERRWTILAGTDAWIAGTPEAPHPTALGVSVASSNPVRVGGRAALDLAVPATGDLRLSVVDATGRRVRDLHRGAVDPGTHRFTWDGHGDDGRALAAGVYFVDARLGDRSRSAKIVLVP
jgi:hypothetical protein